MSARILKMMNITLEERVPYRRQIIHDLLLFDD
jgi:hypothetical protein